MSFDASNDKIREICENLLKNNEVEVVIGYTKGEEGELRIPCFVKDPADCAKLEWSELCYSNLATYLHGLNKKAAILAKPCDTRAISQYITEQQVKRENVVIIGIDCIGMKDEEGNARPGCAECTVRKPVVFDYHVEDARVNEIKSAEKATLPESSEEKMEKFKKEMDKCILCYACRQSCYGCYCKNCFIERDATDWQPIEIDTGSKMTFHMGRTMHLAGRCVDCGACEAACASGVNIRYIIKEVTDFVEELYDYRAGLDPEKSPALLENAFDDKEVGFLGGEKHG